MNEKKNILVTGANGQLGMEFRSMAAVFTGFNFIFVSKEELSVTDINALLAFFEVHDIFCCINCAAYTKVDMAETEKEMAFEINANAVGELSKICRNYKSHLIHFSTDYVFPGDAERPYNESEVTGPVSAYGASKLAGEKLAVENNENAIIIRSSWVYSSHGNNFVKTMLRLLREKETIRVVNDQLGSPTYAADLAYAVMQIISTDYFIPGIYHYCNAGVISWHTFANRIKEEIDSQCIIKPVSTSEFPTTAKRPSNSALDTTKVKMVFGIQIRGWEDSLHQCLEIISVDEQA